MVTSEEKLLRLTDELARAKGLELVVHHYSDGSGFRMRFEDPSTFNSTLESISHGSRRSTAAATFEKVKELLNTV